MDYATPSPYGDIGQYLYHSDILISLQGMDSREGGHLNTHDNVYILRISYFQNLHKFYKNFISKFPFKFA